MPNDKALKETKGKFQVPLTYKGKNLMTRMQWRCHQRRKKAKRESTRNEREAPAAKHIVATSKLDEKPYSKGFNKEERLQPVPKKNSKPSSIKGRLWVREATPEYSP